MCNLAYVFNYKPFSTPLLNRIEIMNDIVALSIVVILMIFCDPVIGDYERKVMGFIQVTISVLCFIVHLVATFFNQFLDCRNGY